MKLIGFAILVSSWGSHQFYSALLQGEDKKAIELLSKVQSKLQEAKTIQLEFKSEVMVGGNAAGDMSGSLLIGESNRLRLEFEGDVDGVKGETKIISDGSKIKVINKTEKEPNVLGDSSKFLSQKLKISLGRLGVYPGCFYLIRIPGMILASEKDSAEMVEKMYQISSVRIIREEMIQGKKCPVITFEVKNSKDESKWNVTTWIDSEKQLPIKGLYIISKSGKEMSFCETYEILKVDVPFADDKFK